MIKEIKYNGFTETPSDYECPDGDLDTAMSLIPEDGAIRPVAPSATIGTITGAIKLPYIHSTSQYKHLVWLNENDICYKDINNSEQASIVITTLPINAETPVDMKSIGNMLLLSTDCYTHFLFWRQEEEKYVYLGNEIPMPDIRFALQTNLVSSTYKTANFTFTESATTGEEAWQDIASMDFTSKFNITGVSSISVYTYSAETDYISLPESCTIDAGTDYKCLVQTNTSYGSYKSGLFGRNSANDSWKELAKSSIGKKNNITLQYRADAGYRYLAVKLYVKWSDTVVSAVKPSLKPNGKITFSKGITHEDTVHIHLTETQESVNQCAAAINKFVKNEGNAKNRFIYPFFVRYALRLYDGTYARISQPALMLPNTGYVPFVNFAKDNSELRLFSFAAELELAVFTGIHNNWKDIIDGVDVFVSQPVYAYDQSVEYNPAKDATRCIEAKEGLSTSIGWFPLGSGTAKYHYTETDLYYQAAQSFTMHPYLLQFAPKSDSDIIADVTKTNQFYKIKSFDFNDLLLLSNNGSFTGIDMEKGTMDSLLNKPTISEEFVQYGNIAGRMHVYNSRLHIFDAVCSLPQPVPPESLNGQEDELTRDPYDHDVTCLVYLKVNGQTHAVRHTSHNGRILRGRRWFFYPDSRAYMAVFYINDENMCQQVQIPLKKHDFLNGAYYIADSLQEKYIVDSFSEDFTEPVVVTAPIPNPSVVYVSDVNNPFVFRNASVVQVGAERIMALSSAAKALSEGQFGQFPLYAFTNEGVWALEVSSDGKYTARQPITRDVCINPSSITQLDSAVLFATDRGIMLLSGSKSQCISDEITSQNTFSLDSLPNLHSILGNSVTDTMQYVPFRDFLMDCRMIYDYTHQRIIVYNPAQPYAYVYSLKSKKWGMLPSTIQQSLNSYPDAYALIKSDNGLSTIINYSDEDSGTGSGDDTAIKAVHGTIITRPLKLDNPDILKTVNTIIQRGQFRRGAVKTILYGSRDLFTWHYVWSSSDHFLRGFRGTPYKYFRLALICDLQNDESVSGCTVQFTPRLANQPR